MSTSTKMPPTKSTAYRNPEVDAAAPWMARNDASILGIVVDVASLYIKLFQRWR